MPFNKTRGELALYSQPTHTFAEIIQDKKTISKKKKDINRISFKCKEGQHQECFAKGCICSCGHKI